MEMTQFLIIYLKTILIYGTLKNIYKVGVFMKEIEILVEIYDELKKLKKHLVLLNTLKLKRF